MDDDQCEAMAEAEAVLKLLESSEGSTEAVMEGFAMTVKQSGTIQKLTADEVVDMMNKPNNNILCLDARTPKEYNEGHIPGKI